MTREFYGICANCRCQKMICCERHGDGRAECPDCGMYYAKKSPRDLYYSLTRKIDFDDAAALSPELQAYIQKNHWYPLGDRYFRIGFLKKTEAERGKLQIFNLSCAQIDQLDDSQMTWFTFTPDKLSTFDLSIWLMTPLLDDSPHLPTTWISISQRFNQ